MEKIKAVIQKVIPEGNHGPFAVATSESIDGSITFSLEPTVWREDEWPDQGIVVVLGKLRKKRAGWRAKSGRFFKPSDEQKEIGNQERRKEMQERNELTIGELEERGEGSLEECLSGIRDIARLLQEVKKGSVFKEVTIAPENMHSHMCKGKVLFLTKIILDNERSSSLVISDHGVFAILSPCDFQEEENSVHYHVRRADIDEELRRIRFGKILLSLSLIVLQLRIQATID